MNNVLREMIVLTNLVAQTRKLNAESALLEQKPAELEERIKKALRTLENLLSRDGGPAWKEAQLMVRSDVRLAMSHLTESNNK